MQKLECHPLDEIIFNLFLYYLQVKGGTTVSNVVDFAKKSIDSKEYRAVVWSGSGGGVTKTISCAEIMKRDSASELHQITRLCYRKYKNHLFRYVVYFADNVFIPESKSIGNHNWKDWNK